jgi:hypothetical protein
MVGLLACAARERIAAPCPSIVGVHGFTLIQVKLGAEIVPRICCSAMRRVHDRG